MLGCGIVLIILGVVLILLAEKIFIKFNKPYLKDDTNMENAMIRSKRFIGSIPICIGIVIIITWLIIL